MVIQEHARRPGQRWSRLAVLAVLIGPVGFLAYRHFSEPAYGGKRVSEWFEQAVVGPPNAPEVQAAFHAMEGKAVPFLVRRIERRHSWWVRNYSRLRGSLPRFMRRTVPRQVWSYDEVFKAMELLGYIGNTQRFKIERGEPIRGERIASAFPTFRGVLNDQNPMVRERSVQPLNFIGWPAAEFIPDLILMAVDEHAPGSRIAVQALGMGPQAFRAVAVLESVIMNTNRQDREATLRMAIASLGAIGPAAARATPLLVPHVSSTNELVRRATLRAFAEIGTIPEAALPHLHELAQGTNEWHRALAHVALWQMDRSGDPAARAPIVAALQGKHAEAMASVLAGVGRRASVFLPDLQQMTQHPDANRRNAAKQALWWIEEKWLQYY